MGNEYNKSSYTQGPYKVSLDEMFFERLWTDENYVIHFEGHIIEPPPPEETADYWMNKYYDLLAGTKIK